MSPHASEDDAPGTLPVSAFSRPAYNSPMPELPEVETTRRGIEPLLKSHRVNALEVREPRLRWPVEHSVNQCVGQQLIAVNRRAKYLLMDFGTGHLVLHLGMSGSLRVLDRETAPGKHDHVDILFDNTRLLRFNDPRRFGALFWANDPARHELLSHLGPEPLGEGFNGEYLYRQSRGKKAPVKNFLMDGRVVVGVGNIYASEALFQSRIHPRRPAGRISLIRYQALVEAVKDVLTRAIHAGGTTLRDFAGGDGQPGYFQQDLAVYGREGKACRECGKPLRREVVGQRSTYFCVKCQS